METVYITEEIKAEVTPEMVAEISKESKKNYYRVSHGNSLYYEHSYICQRAREIAFKGSLYKDKSPLYKNLLAANIAFPDDEKFVDILVRYGFTLEKMQLINNPETDPYVKITFIYEFAQILKKYFGSSVTSLALNKANEIIVFNPTLFQKTEQKNKKPIR